MGGLSYGPRRGFGSMALRRRGRRFGTKLGKRRTGRAYGGTRTKRRKFEQAAGYNQFTLEKRVTGRRIGRAAMNRKLMRAAKESIIYTFNRVKNFDDHGLTFCDNAYYDTTNTRYLPVFALLLNGRNTSQADTYPLVQLRCDKSGASDGLFYWSALEGNDPATGLVNRRALNVETDSHSSIYNTEGRKLYWDWTDLKLNLWGAKNKAVKFTVQVVRALDDELSPFYGLLNNPTLPTSGPKLTLKAQQHWEELIKQYTYNPITQLHYANSKGLKVLKSWDKIIQPTASYENDADPHCHVLKWFQRYNKVVRFDEELYSLPGDAYRISDDADLETAKQPAQVGQIYPNCAPNSREQVFLLIRASDYVDKAISETSNLICGSFDIAMRTKFSRLD